MERATLIRTVGGRGRYYRVLLSETLFGDFEVERVYGACRNKKPTGSRRNTFETSDVAEQYFKNTIKSKCAKGYSLKPIFSVFDNLPQDIVCSA